MNGGSGNGGGCGFFGASCIGHFVSDVANGFAGTLGGMATGAFHLAVQLATQPIWDTRNCLTGRLISCLYLGGMTNPLYQMRMGNQLITGAVLGTVQTGKSIYHDFTTGHPGRAIGAIGAYAALFALTRGAGAAPEAGAAASADSGLLPGTTGVASTTTSSDWAVEAAARQHEFDETTYDVGHAAENVGSTAENAWAALEPPPAPTGTVTGVASGLPVLTAGAEVGVGDPLSAIFLNGALATRATWAAFRAIFGSDG